MSCDCGSDKIISVSGKTGDMCNVSYKDVNVDGRVPRDIGIGGGDYLEFNYCGECGMLQDFEALSDEDIARALEE